jgi:predicted TIM-barrel fold metal-dependent hydrolase
MRFFTEPKKRLHRQVSRIRTSVIKTNQMGKTLPGCAALYLILALSAAGETPLPIIDMHLHAHSLADYGGGMPVCTNDQTIVYPGADPRKPMTIDRLMTCKSPLPAAATDEAVMTESLAMLKRYNIWAVTSGSLERVSAWRAASPDRIIPAIAFATSRDTPSPEEFRRLFAAGKFAVFAEVGAQYRGRRLDEPSFEPYFALAEELDIPVGSISEKVHRAGRTLAIRPIAPA